MEKEKIYLISDASKKVEVESHVLRYWEDELKLPVKRNELGHRYYTEEDITEFREIKKLKEQGLQLKAIRMSLKNGKLTRLFTAGQRGGKPWKTGSSGRAWRSAAGRLKKRRGFWACRAGE